MTDALDAITTFVRRDRAGSLPPNVVQQAKRLLLDGISWMVMGARKAEAQPLLSTATTTGSTGPCTVIGTGRRASLIEALFANTALAQVHDCNDGRRLARRDGGSNHPGRCVLPVALALAEEHRLPGHALLDLIVTGYEVASRARVRHDGMDYSFTVAGMMSRVLGSAPDSIRRALVLAGLTFPMPVKGQRYDTDYDFLAQGFIARAAATATLNADTARTLPADNLGVTLGSAFPGSGSRGGFEILNVYIKPYPCCRALHGAIDLALELRALDEFAPTDIADIGIHTGNKKAFLFEATAADASYKRCQFSIPYATACALLDGEVGEASFSPERIAAGDVADLQARIHCVYDPALEFNPEGFASHFRPSSLTLTTKQGKTYARELVAPKGSVINPLSDRELLAKFEAWTGPSLSSPVKEQIVGLVRGLESVDDVSHLMRLL
ncbi:MAG: MmgE/PrpD family protein [Gemmatimonadaceae bacterium]